MQVNLNCNCPKPQFGMAFRKPKDMDALIKYAKLENPVNIKGMRQFIAEQAKLSHFDTAFDSKTGEALVINNSTGKVADTIIDTPNQTGFDTYTETPYPGRKILSKIFNPKKYLPRNIYEAGEEAKQYEKLANKYNSTITEIDKLF